MTTPPLSLVVVSAGASDPSSTRMLADRAARAAVRAADKRGRTVEVTTIDVRELLPELPAALSSQHFGPGFTRAIAALADADAIVAASPVYKAGLSGAFTSFFQVLDNDLLIGVPVILAATAGTSRHALVVDGEMRSLFAYLRTLPVPTSLFATAEDWGNNQLGARVDRAAAELVLLMESGFARAVRDDGWDRYSHELGSNAGREAEIQLDSDMMRLATGGTVASPGRGNVGRHDHD